MEAQIKIGDEGYAAVIYIDDRSVIKIKEKNAKFSFMDSPNTRTIDLVHGALLNKINKESRTQILSHTDTRIRLQVLKEQNLQQSLAKNGIEQFVCKEGLF